MPEAPSPFLNVSKSVTGRTWVDRLDEQMARTAQAISQRGNLSEILARIIAARGVGIGEAEEYLNPTIRGLMPDPSTLSDMDRLADRLVAAITNNEKVALFGDYDVDGASSCALMSRYLRHFGLDPDVHIPDRIFEGYGPNIAAIDKLIDAGATLLITLDCGTTSDKPDRPRPRTRHRRAGDRPSLVRSRAAAGHRAGQPEPARRHFRARLSLRRRRHLHGAGRHQPGCCATRGDTGQPDLLQLLDLVALATVCDVVPLTGLNRAFVVRGLEVARRLGNRGIGALALAARVTGPLNPYHLGFLVGPRINAGGRIGDAALGARLLTIDDEHEALVIAARLNELNTERQRIEIEAVDEATRVAESEIGNSEGPPILVLASANWHAGVVGLVAARLRERFERPAFAIALHPDGTGTGSGRSMPGVDLGHAVIAAVDAGIIPKGGGHAMAAGVTILPGQIGAFRAHLSQALAGQVGVARALTALKIDAALTARGANVGFVEEIERAGPFGAGNPQPVFAFPAHRAKFAEVVGAGGHVKFTLTSDDGGRLKAIAFRAATTPLGQALLAAGNDGRLHIAGTLSLDHYQGRAEAQLRVIDAAQPEAVR